MRSRAVLALGLALVAAAAGLTTFPVSASPPGPPDPPATRVIDGRIDDWRGTSSGLGGTWQRSAGELVYQDHLYDDLGAHTGQRAEQYGTVGAPAGDVRYPTDDARYGRNAADLLELRLASDGTDLFVLARLNTLKVPDSTVVALALDTTTDERTEAEVAWPHGAGVSVAGADHVVTLWGTGGDLTDLRDEAAPAAAVDTAADTGNDHNAIEARVPLAELDLAADGAFRVWAATGLWTGSAWMPIGARQSATEPGGASPTAPTPPVFNVAFRDHETGSFFEERQAAALAAGDLSSFFVDVDLGELSAVDDDPYPVEAGRFYSVILDTGFEIDDGTTGGEGVAYDGLPGRFRGAGGAALAQEFNFFGRHQPYGLYLPTTHDGTTPHPAALVMHGLGGSHSSYNAYEGFLADMGEGAGTGLPSMYLVTPLARGSSFYADWGEVETLRVLDDTLARVPVDDERLYLTGYSMGGYGVYRLASLYPDRFAAAGVWAGYSGEFTGSYLTEPPVESPLGTPVTDTVGRPNQGKANIGDPVDTMENLRHLPLVLASGTNDEIVPTPGQYAAIDRLRDLGYRNRWDLYPGYDHFAFGLLDDWQTVRAYLGDQRRETRPRHITHRFSDGWTLPEVAAAFGLDHGNAWWLQELTMREPTTDAFTLATADAVSHGVAGGEPVPVFHDPEPVAEPTPHVRHEVTWSPPAIAPPTANHLELRLAGVGTGTVDLAGAGLAACGLRLTLTTDGATTIRFVGKLPGNAAITGLPGATLERAADGRSSRLHVPAAVDGAGTLTCGRPLPG
jgi:dienelactone hydrolase